MLNFKQRVLSCATTALYALLATTPGLARPAEVWFAPSDNLPRAGRVMDSDFPALFDEPPSWNTDIDVFQMTPYFATKAEESELLRVQSFLDRHHIALAVASQPMQVTNECDLGEGRSRPGTNLRLFRRLKALGLRVRYVALDEPLTFGHFNARGERPCMLPIDDVARRVALTINEIRQSYPDAKIVDYEAPPDLPANQWAGVLGAWLDAYQAATGSAFYALVFDVNWRRPWLGDVTQGIASLHAHGVRPGMFLTIAGPGTSDEGAVASLEANIAAVQDAHLPLAITVLACWTPFPTHSVPASDPTSLTSALDDYLARRR